MVSKINRRVFIHRATLASLAIPFGLSQTACVDVIDDEVPLPDYEYDGPSGPSNLFEHGVASGDPLPDGVVIWTRASTDQEELDVWWEIATDAEFNDRVQVGTATANASQDWTVKVDVSGLRAGQTYYYRFKALDKTSVVGRTRTAARSTDHVRLGVVSCSNIAKGYFHAYRDLATRKDLDAVLHLGDYFYEYGSSSEIEGRTPEPRYEIVSLDDYRTRYSFYRRDSDLQEVHRQHPFIPVWDDHESTNDSSKDGAQNHQSAEEGPWEERKAAAQQAWFEWMPVRDQETRKIWRLLQFGKLIDLVMLDTRLWGRDYVAIGDAAADPERTMLGFDQEEWLHDTMRESTATWRIVGQQVMMGQLKAVAGLTADGGGSFVNMDQWDGYRASRTRFYNALAEAEVNNLVVLTGDIHSSWAIDLTPDPNNPEAYDPTTGTGAIGAEFVTPGVTSSGLAGLSESVVSRLLGINPHIKYAELTQRGFMVLDVLPERVQADWFHIEDVEAPETDIFHAASWATLNDQQGILEFETLADEKDSAPELAP